MQLARGRRWLCAYGRRIARGSSSTAGIRRVPGAAQDLDARGAWKALWNKSTPAGTVAALERRWTEGDFSGAKENANMEVALLSAARRLRDADMAARILQAQVALGRPIETLHMNQLLHTLASTGNHRELLGTMRELVHRGVKPDAVSIMLAMTSLQEQWNHDSALRLFQECLDGWAPVLGAGRDRGSLRLTRSCYRLALRSAFELLDGARAERLLAAAEQQGLQPDLVMYRYAINLAKCVSDWRQAVRLVKRLRRTVMAAEPVAGRGAPPAAGADSVATVGDGLPGRALRTQRQQSALTPVLSIALSLCADAAESELQARHARESLVETRHREPRASQLEGVLRLRCGAGADAAGLLLERCETPWQACEAIASLIEAHNRALPADQLPRRIRPSVHTVASVIRAAPDAGAAGIIFEWYTGAHGAAGSTTGALVYKAGASEHQRVLASGAADERGAVEAAATAAWEMACDVAQRFPDCEKRGVLPEVLAFLAAADAWDGGYRGLAAYAPPRYVPHSSLADLADAHVLLFPRDRRPKALEAARLWREASRMGLARFNQCLPQRWLPHSRLDPENWPSGPVFDISGWPPHASHLPLHLFFDDLLLESQGADVGVGLKQCERQDRLLVFTGRTPRLASGVRGDMSDRARRQRVDVARRFLLGLVPTVREPADDESVEIDAEPGISLAATYTRGLYQMSLGELRAWCARNNGNASRA